MPSVQDIQNQLQGLRAGAQGANGVNWNDFYTQATQYARQNQLNPNDLAQAAQGMEGGQGWDANRVQQIMAQFGPKPNSFGLSASFGALNQGAQDATQRIGQTQQQVGDLYRQGLQMLQPYMQQGGQANQLQAALSGALGLEAQKKAYADYQNSPGVQWAQQQGEQSVLRNAAAAGGLGGGNTLKALQAFGTGLALQDYGNNFSRLGQVADRGYGAATTGAGLQGQQAGIQSQLGQFNANIPLQTASQLGALQYSAGRDMATNIANVTSSLSNLVNAQGAGMTDIYGNNTNNISALLQNAANGDANAKQQLATMLSNLGVQAGSQYSGLPMIQPLGTNYLGQLGQVASGVGGLMYGMNRGNTATNYPNPATQPYLYQNTDANYSLGNNGVYG